MEIAEYIVTNLISFIEWLGIWIYTHPIRTMLGIMIFLLFRIGGWLQNLVELEERRARRENRKGQDRS